MRSGFRRGSVLDGYCNSRLGCKTASAPRRSERRHGSTPLSSTVLALALLTFGFCSALQLARTPAAQAQDASILTSGSPDQSEDLQNSDQSESPVAEDTDQDQVPARKLKGVPDGDGACSLLNLLMPIWRK
jgi:hypothetical protein